MAKCKLLDSTEIEILEIPTKAEPSINPTF
jgi:hypothetical protein